MPGTRRAKALDRGQSTSSGVYYDGSTSQATYRNGNQEGKGKTPKNEQKIPRRLSRGTGSVLSTDEPLYEDGGEILQPQPVLTEKEIGEKVRRKPGAKRGPRCLRFTGIVGLCIWILLSSGIIGFGVHYHFIMVRRMDKMTSYIETLMNETVTDQETMTIQGTKLLLNYYHKYHF